MTAARLRLGLVGARGYVGRELLGLLATHPRFVVDFVSSRTSVGTPVRDVAPTAPPELRFEDLTPEAVAARGVDAVVLALANDASAPFCAAVDAAAPSTVLVDVSADHRFDDGWRYGLPELRRAELRGARRIANPGCYATATALALAPVAELLCAPAEAFGVSGYSGAGATPSPRNDVEALRDNVMPYSLTGHLHEREVTRHVAPVHLMPHVAPFFRGMLVTVALPLTRTLTLEELIERYEARYAGEPFVRVQPAAPLPRDAARAPHATLGGFAVAERRAVVVATLDNLLKGAASQALQNLNLAFGLPEAMGVLP